LIEFLFLLIREQRNNNIHDNFMKPASLILILGLAIASWPAMADDKWDIAKMDLSKLPAAADTKGVTFDKDIRPLFEESCLRCHGDERQKGGLRLDSLDGALKGGKAGKIVIPGSSEKSLLVAAAAQVNDDVAMPPKHGPGGHRPPSGPDGGGPPPDGQGGPRPGGPGGFGPPSHALTSEQVGLIRAWIDQGAK
jgi:hypothetical protein